MLYFALITESQELQLQRNTGDQLPGVFISYTGFLQGAYKEHRVSEQFLAERKEGVIYLHSCSPIFFAHCLCFTLQKAHSPVLPRLHHAAPQWPCPGVAFHPMLEAEV